MPGGGTLVWAAMGVLGLAALVPQIDALADRALATPAEPHHQVETISVAPSAAAGTAGNGYAEQTVTRSRDGHFYVDAQIGAARVRMLVDTGSSVVALSRADAQRAGFAVGDATLQGRAAGGAVALSPLALPRVSVGPIAADNVRAAVSDNLPVSLLGQSFLSRLSSVEISGDRMVLR